MKTIVLVAFFTICYVVCMDLVNKYMSNIQFETTNNTNSSTSSSNIYSVTILGEIKNPGTYNVTKDSTLGYLITLAGGLTENADITCFNSNVTIEKNQSYYISFLTTEKKVSINSATQASLDSLPGIGEVFSKRIIEYRTQNGGFKTIDELKKVTGIGDSLYENLKNLICL